MLMAAILALHVYCHIDCYCLHEETTCGIDRRTAPINDQLNSIQSSFSSGFIKITPNYNKCHLMALQR